MLNEPSVFELLRFDGNENKDELFRSIVVKVQNLNQSYQHVLNSESFYKRCNQEALIRMDRWFRKEKS